MPPKGIRICVDDHRCTHTANDAWSCSVCLSVIKVRLANGTAYLCSECRQQSKGYGMVWPKKDSSKKSAVTKDPKVTQDKLRSTQKEKLNTENGISKHCPRHKQTIPKTEKNCEDCVYEFCNKIDNCGICEGEFPNYMDVFCTKHRKMWEIRTSEWSVDTELFKQASRYPQGETEEFLKGLTEICILPHIKKMAGSVKA
jgi:hypothetical protein